MPRAAGGGKAQIEELVPVKPRADGLSLHRGARRVAGAYAVGPVAGPANCSRDAGANNGREGWRWGGENRLVRKEMKRAFMRMSQLTRTAILERAWRGYRALRKGTGTGKSLVHPLSGSP